MRIPYLYVEPVATLIHALKFRRRLAVASVLGGLLAAHLESPALEPPQYIVPVPLHPKRQRERGFNQSMEIARPLSARLDVPIAPRLARRTRPTAAQSSLEGRDSRRRNVRGAFCAEIRPTEAVHHVAMVDDVVTTGATVMALARALKRAGVARIDLWCVARAGDP
ncbi:MAG TPA: ComF family protein [Gammaproteobacteria bacterium]|nr:ComF family protein [Gammaproteobacteria bacterium]